LAEAEGEAIRSRDWGLVSACQKALEDLQPRMSRMLSDARAQWAGVARDRAARESRLTAILRELIQIEHNNQTLLSAMQAVVREKLDQMGGASRNLKRLQHSYDSFRPAAWNSFS
jgi:hypothetical protein